MPQGIVIRAHKTPPYGLNLDACGARIGLLFAFTVLLVCVDFILICLRCTPLFVYIYFRPSRRSLLYDLVFVLDNSCPSCMRYICLNIQPVVHLITFECYFWTPMLCFWLESLYCIYCLHGSYWAHRCWILLSCFFCIWPGAFGCLHALCLRDLEFCDSSEQLDLLCLHKLFSICFFHLFCYLNFFTS